jgi:hypothetical protein
VCEVFHVIGFALLIGTIFMVDLRLLGLGMKRQTSAELVKDTAPWTLLGLALILITGPLIFLSDPALYLGNISFQLKMLVLVIAILYNWTIHRKVASSPDPGGAATPVAILSVLLWASLPFLGIFIAFV